MSRHYPTRGAEVLESFEWLYKDHLRKLDHLTRQMWIDLRYAGLPEAEIRETIQDFFACCWEQVAETEEQKTNKTGRRKSATHNTRNNTKREPHV